MKKYKIIFVLLTISLFGHSQQIHSPAEIVKILNDSKLSYEINMLDKTIECKDFSDKLNYHDCYRVSTDSGLITYKYRINEKAKPFFDKAEAFFSTHVLDSALLYYKQAIDVDTTLYNVMTYIGQIYGTKKDYEKAIFWYKKVIMNNFIDYMAHWFLADIYLKINDIEKAADEIVIAQILNRNNPRIKEEWTNILAKAKRDNNDWCFNPQFEIKKVSDSKISIAMNEKWTGYAMAKALWMYEPGYRESMGISEGQYSTLEDKECLISLLMGLENAKINIKKDPQLITLKEAAESKYLDEYILYEIVLPQAPFVAFQLPVETIMSLKDYILKIRNN